MNTHPNFYEWRHLEQAQEPMNAWSPRVDPESPLPFMPMEPIDLMTGGSFTQVPWIVGLTDDEGMKIQTKLSIEYISTYIKSYNCIHRNVSHEFLFVLKRCIQSIGFLWCKRFRQSHKRIQRKV